MSDNFGFDGSEAPPQQYGNNGGNGNNSGYQNNYGNNSNNGGYQKKQWNNNQGGGGGYKSNYQGGGGNYKGGYQGGGGGSGFKKNFNKDTGPGELYRPVSVFSNENPPPEVVERAKQIAEILNNHEYTVRHDGLSPIAKTFEGIFSTRKELYLPWKNFNEQNSSFSYSTTQSMDIVKKFFPAFDKIKDSAKAFLSRGVRMILGQNLKSNTSLVIVWTEDGVEDSLHKTAQTGFSGFPMGIAFSMYIPVINLQNANCVERVKKIVEPIPTQSNPQPQQSSEVPHNNY